MDSRFRGNDGAEIAGTTKDGRDARAPGRERPADGRIGRTGVSAAAGRRAVLLFLLFCLAAFGLSPAWAYKAGEGADDRPADIPEYANVAAYLADSSRTDHIYVKIGQHTLRMFQLEAFHDNTGLTDGNLIQSYASVTAYLADTGRAGRLYAEINGSVFLVTVLEAANNAGTLSASTLPSPVAARFRTTAVGDGARAQNYDATAIGQSARATGRQSTAVGQNSGASGVNAVALGDYSRAYGDRSVALGTGSRAYGDHTTALGNSADGYGAHATALGRSATALGERTTALGRGAVAANLDADRELGDAVSESDGVGGLITCAHDTDLSVQGFVADCDEYLTAGERGDSRLARDDATGQAFRQTIRQRLQGRLTALSTSRATAVGMSARALKRSATAVGYYSQATGESGTALGSASDAAGERSTALGAAAWATGRYSTAVGQWAEAHGENTIALGRNSKAGGVSSSWIYTSVEEYVDDSDRTTRGTNVIIGGKVYAVSALEAVSGLDRTNLPAPVAATSGGVAVGADAAAAGEDSVALGKGATATGAKGIAIGAGAAAGANEVVIGSAGHTTYRMPGLAASQTRNAEVLTVTRTGVVSSDGGDLNDRLGQRRDTAKVDGNAYERIRSIRDTLDMATTEEFRAITRTNVIQQVREATDSFDADTTGDGRVDDFGDGRKIREIVDQVDRDIAASHAGTVPSSQDAARVVTTRIVEGDEEARTVVTLKGATNEQVTALVALLMNRRLSTAPVLDESGNPVGTTMDKFLALDEDKGVPLSTNERLAYLFQAIYGRPYRDTGGVADTATDSRTPHADSIAGRIDSIDKLMPREADGTLEEAPVTEAGTPSGVQRRVVVQDVYQDDGTRRVRLRTLDLGQLSGIDRRVDALGRRVDGLDRHVGKLGARLDKATAMSSALTALPNVVPNGGQFYLGAGAGHYRGQQAIAIGMSARVGARNNVFLNAGAATAGGGSVSSRAGVGFVW